jgi:hypothetical protein
MKKNSAFTAVALLVAILFSCSKKSSNNTTPNPPPLTAEVWPQKWILTLDKDANTYKYLHRVGIVINRNDLGKSYPFSELAKEKDCNWEVKSEGQRNGKAVYSFHLEKNKIYRWSVGKTGTVNGMEEWYLGVHQGNNPPNTDDWLFYLHEGPERNGNKTVAIESVSKPGWYAGDMGHTLTANGVKMIQPENPGKIVYFERH